ncbi:MAG: hypothetical protein L0Z62_26235 [Gemmataceae bacterium]|nr:hypothetical protein [Gemmataceae bacterium]
MSTPPSRAHEHRVRLAVEALEDRLTPAASLIASLVGDVLNIEGTDGPDRIVLWLQGGRLEVQGQSIETASGPAASVAARDVRQVVVNALDGDDVVSLNQDLWGSEALPAAAVIEGGPGNDYLAGGPGNDILNGDLGWDTILGHLGDDSLDGGPGDDQLFGEAGNDVLVGDGGNDVLVGGAGNDHIRGGEGRDQLFGEAGNDALFGGSGRDSLRGGAGSDMLDSGTPGEDADGEDDWDLDVYQWAAGGVRMEEVLQRDAPLCGFLAALGAVARQRGPDLERGISYLGDHLYAVRLYRAGAGWVTHHVLYNGILTGSDPNPAGEGKFWAVLYQRAWVQERAALGLNEVGLPSEALTALTGLPGSGLFATDQAAFLDALFDNRFLVVSTSPDPSRVSAQLIANHGYVVLGLDAAGRVVLRNPWGFDGGAQPTDSPRDGVVAVTWAEFTQSMLALWFC